ncbi:alpha-(1-_3)-arabinofuranosyltransferase domain-containing protein [Corynebacterium aquilae]|uniref:alpha-(1->3)-arabinofuranosyltransferase domain-containing protein n=1 Tax=Corynebacterium aquilae TaxID=203263 RepID=UPI0009FC0599|nr:alpha-(1->3)-arabinofuranosyltransferase family protein [Corynebacterium aquilae]
MNTAPATSRRASLAPHLLGWLLLALAVFRHPGVTTADTKHDLAAQPGHFLRGAAEAYTPNFAFGQVQNQAFGYLFPHGLFFQLTAFFPDWLAQRLWWLLLLGIGYSGTVFLLRRLAITSPIAIVCAGLLFALSPRVMGTLSTISSESWPAMLTPWMVAVLLPRRPNQQWWRGIAPAVVCVALMGAVNATATIAALLPGVVVVLASTRFFGLRHTIARLCVLALGILAVTAWWIVPLLVLGAYAAPFVEFIESAYTTTRFANLAEILRGSDHWVAFVSSERFAGHLISTNATYVLITGIIAAIGLWGLAHPRTPHRGLWVFFLFAGALVMSASLGPAGASIQALLDGPLLAFRNVHKWDVWVRLPLVVGFATATAPVFGRYWSWRALARPAAATAALVVLAALTPATAGLLLPAGAYRAVPDYVRHTADYLNTTPSPTAVAASRGNAVPVTAESRAASGRVLVVPAVSFARQDYGWTRDEPLQPLLDVPWAVRDAIPLINPETIRGLDGAQAVLLNDDIPAHKAFAAMASMGIDRLVVRTDIAAVRHRAEHILSRAHQAGLPIKAFTEKEDPTTGYFVVTLAASTTGELLHAAPVPVAGSGDVLALLAALYGPTVPFQLTTDGSKAVPDSGSVDSAAGRATLGGSAPISHAPAQIITDTPALAVRNYGTVERAESAFLTREDTATSVRNRLQNYPGTGPATVADDLAVWANSSAADVDALGGADQERAPAMAVDGDPDTAWYPQPGAANPRLVLQLTSTRPVVDITITGRPARLKVWGASASDATWIDAVPGIPQKVSVPGGPTTEVSIAIPGSRGATGIAEISPHGALLARPVIRVPDAPPSARAFVFQRLSIAQPSLKRDFTTARSYRLVVGAGRCDLPVTIDGADYTCGQVAALAAGPHTLSTANTWVSLTEEGFIPGSESAHTTVVPTGLTNLPGLSAPGATPISIGPGLVAFDYPSAPSEVTVSHAGNSTYRAGVVGGGIVGVLALVVCAILSWRERAALCVDVAVPQTFSSRGAGRWLRDGVALCSALLVAWCVGGIAGVLAAVVVTAVVAVRPNLAPVLAAGGVAGACWWLAHGPWTQPQGYAGDSWVVAASGVAALVALVAPSWRR